MSERDALCAAVERAAVASWPALERADVDGWIWRWSAGGSIRGNTVSALQFRGGDVDAAIDRVEVLYGAKGVPCMFTMTCADTPSDLDRRLDARGYVRGEEHVTMTKVVDRHVTLPPGVAVGVQPTNGWMDAYLSGLSMSRRQAAPRLIANLPAAAVFVSADVDGCAIASGLTVIDHTAGLASVQCMATLPAARRTGGALRVLAGIEALAAQNNVRTLYLQTSGDNAAARRLYEGFGFTVLSHYHTRTKPSRSAL
jgi:N-acetylglutamate synthase